MVTHWKIMEPVPPSLCISVIGGAKSFKLDGKMRETFNTGLIKVRKKLSVEYDKKDISWTWEPIGSIIKFLPNKRIPSDYAKFAILSWLSGGGSTLHSAIFQLYSDRTVVHFPNLDMLPETQRRGQRGVFNVLSWPGHGHRDFWRSLLLPGIRGPTCGECDLPSYRVKAVASFGQEDENPMSNLSMVIISLFLV